MKTLIASLLFVTAATGSAFAADMQIPWADNSGGTESNHVAAVGQDLNYQHQQITKSKVEGVWADASGSISADEQALTSQKPPVVADPKLMPHQG
ncbi:hypothetical protein [Enterobacillus tribolii]|uniref:Secreted protein n=1 Tax=Enterobacillus tribolii TaxID=1487935 RepID=A0A370R3P6_9GAMM|nr:hypothetical protein [Enterobacillus tribolii]MBW7984112.1 hypothetical protein [Enterobacillus tribolii]RDK97054.1 hypothetical protein C8D90_101498 [Enterobacillus tribolii]